MPCDVTGGAGITECESAGSGKEYTACGATPQCKVGLTCMDGACKSMCNTAADCPGAGRTCQQVYYEGFPVTGWLVCSSACDPTNPTACGTGLTCLASSATATDCVGPAGTGIGPGSCGPGLPCAPGYVCMLGAASYDCKKWCRIGGSDCAAGETCGGATVTVNGVSYGACS